MENIVIKSLSPQNIWDYENGFYWFSNPSRLAKLMAHYEIYKKCVNLPGAVCEFGVYKGNSLIQLATFRKMLETDEARKIYAFDAFGAFPRVDVKNAHDLKFIKKFESEGG